MSGLRETIQVNAPTWLALGGLLIGGVLGAVLWRTSFCTMGALSDIVNLGEWRRFRAWCLAIGVATAGTQTLDLLGIVALDRSMYLAPTVNWAGHVIGGFLFGIGMVLAGGCVSRNLARAGGGDLRALMVLIVVGLTAYVTIGGILGPARALMERSTSLPLGMPTQSLGEFAARALGTPASTGKAVIGGLMALGLLLFALADDAVRRSPRHLSAGIGVGLAVIAGWALTGLAFDEFADRPAAPISITYVRPTGDAIEWLARYTAAPLPGFGVTTVLGALLGAGAMATAEGRFKLATFADTGDTVRSLGGAVMMGVGGVLALGCTIGQGITGLSTLAIGSFLTFAAIVAGGIYGLKMLERWLDHDG
jgi:uncharacterized protein